MPRRLDYSVLTCWNVIVWSDEFKLDAFRSDAKQYVPQLTELNPKYTKKTIKHRGASVIVWGCFTTSGIGPLVKFKGTMNGEMYRDILTNNLSEENVENLPLAWIFQQDNDSKYCCQR